MDCIKPKAASVDSGFGLDPNPAGQCRLHRGRDHSAGGPCAQSEEAGGRNHAAETAAAIGGGLLSFPVTHFDAAHQFFEKELPRTPRLDAPAGTGGVLTG